jgi:hypothetical protein
MNNENEILLHGSAIEVSRMKCSECSAGLTINFHRNEEKSSISMFCPECFNSLNVDGTFAEPEWAKQLGHHLET